MGQFSFLFTDTEEPIYSTPGHQTKVAMVYLEDGVQKVAYEEAYEGYGVFGDVDFYEALARMNPELIPRAKELDLDLRDLGISLAFGNTPCKSPQFFELKIPEVVNFDIPVQPHDYQGWWSPARDDDDSDWGGY